MSEVNPKTAKIAILAMIAIFMNIAAAAITFDPEQPNFLGLFIPYKNNSAPANDFKTFASEDDFKKYLASAPTEQGYSGIGGGWDTMVAKEAVPSGFSAGNVPQGLGVSESASAPSRVSQTNVQVTGIDEPDIVKTDGKEIYFSGEPRLYYSPMLKMMPEPGISFDERGKIMPQPQESTSVIRAFPVADLALDGKIDKQGDLLLNKDNLIVLGGREITGFNVANPKSPVQKWNTKLSESGYVVASRLYGDKVYLITRNVINEVRPCPFVPLAVGGVEVSISCKDIYHPIVPVQSDTTFTAAVIDPSSGKIEKTVSFVGSTSASIIYMSENSIYASYTYSESMIKFFIGFTAANQDLFPSSVVQKIKKLDTYDISESSKLNEFNQLMQKYDNSLSGDERLKFQTDANNRMTDYYKAHKREIEKTGIVKININDFKIAATGAVPGHLLNNFSMDEYQDNLRVATTIGSRWGIISGIGSGESVSDVTILGKDMKTIGSVQDLGKTEQIYSARFVEDKGYLVTFRQTDPFYVLDLANPSKPVVAGELKIPGFSSYLHPLDATHILGIGMESGKVKISLFDVTDKNNPVELDKYNLDEYWTDVSNNYHAFLLDKKHNVFFLPGGKGGYVFSYGVTFAHPGICKQGENCSNITDYKVELKKAISQNSVKRAIYINDYLYIIGEGKITVVNESDWQNVNELDLGK